MIDEGRAHYWMPVPGDARHAVPGGRRRDGSPNATTACGSTVPLAAPSEIDWIQLKTCSHC